MLLMKKIYFDAIRRGEKTTTLRYWRRCTVAQGTVHFVPGLGQVEILASRQVQLDELTPADARADGFASVQALEQVLDEMYPPADRQGRGLYQICFRYLGANPS